MNCRKVYQFETKTGKLLTEFKSTKQASRSVAVADHVIKYRLQRQDPIEFKGYTWSTTPVLTYSVNTGVDLDDMNNAVNAMLDEKPAKIEPKILLFDIETSPMMVYAWKLWKNTASIDQIALDWTVLTWAAKWLGEDEVMYDTQINYKNINKPQDLDDFEVVEKLWHLFDEANFLVAHNGRAFDTKKINAKFLQHGFVPPSPYKVIDTLDMAKKSFKFTSNKLDYIAQHLGVGSKLPHEGFKLWEKCMWGDPEAWATMLDYNIQDVDILEKVYLKLRSYDPSHPSVSIYKEDSAHACTKCGSTDLEYVKDTYTNTRVYKLYKCNSCNGWSRGRTGVNKKSVLMTQ